MQRKVKDSQKRLLAHQIGRKLTNEEVELVSGGSGFTGPVAPVYRGFDTDYV